MLRDGDPGGSSVGQAGRLWHNLTRTDGCTAELNPEYRAVSHVAKVDTQAIEATTKQIRHHGLGVQALTWRGRSSKRSQAKNMLGSSYMAKPTWLYLPGSILVLKDR